MESKMADSRGEGSAISEQQEYENKHADKVCNYRVYTVLNILSRASEAGSPKYRLGSGLRRDKDHGP